MKTTNAALAADLRESAERCWDCCTKAINERQPKLAEEYSRMAAAREDQADRLEACTHCGESTADGHHGDGRCPREEDMQLDAEYAAWLDSIE